MLPCMQRALEHQNPQPQVVPGNPRDPQLELDVVLSLSTLPPVPYFLVRFLLLPQGTHIFPDWLSPLPLHHSAFKLKLGHSHCERPGRGSALQRGFRDLGKKTEV